MSPLREPVIERLFERGGADLVTLAQCMVLDADAFPYESVQFGLAAREEAARVWVARGEPRGRVLGFLAAFLRAELRVVGLAVDRAARRQGIASALVHEAKAIARDAGVRLVLQVSVTNEAAVALYRSEGFTVRRKLVGYYAPGVYARRDALEMVWTPE